MLNRPRRLCRLYRRMSDILYILMCRWWNCHNIRRRNGIQLLLCMCWYCKPFLFDIRYFPPPNRWFCMTMGIRMYNMSPYNWTEPEKFFLSWCLYCMNYNLLHRHILRLINRHHSNMWSYNHGNYSMSPLISYNC